MSNKPEPAQDHTCTRTSSKEKSSQRRSRSFVRVAKPSPNLDWALQCERCFVTPERHVHTLSIRNVTATFLCDFPSSVSVHVLGSARTAGERPALPRETGERGRGLPVFPVCGNGPRMVINEPLLYNLFLVSITKSDSSQSPLPATL